MRKIACIVITLLILVPLYAQTGRNSLQLSDIVEGKYAAKGAEEMRSLPDGEHYTKLSEDRKAIEVYAYKNGQKVETLFHVDNARETKIDAIEGYMINESMTRILVWTDKEYVYRRSWKANVYDYDIRRNYLKPLSDNPGKVMCPLLSNDGRMCAFVRDNNIWIKKFDYDTEIQITKDGSPGAILNGLTDWVYEEEFTVTSLMSWSVDNNFLAYIKSDETEVPQYSFVVFDQSLYPPVYSYKYPKAGQNNSTVACYAYNVETKDTKKMDVPLDEDSYIPMIKFTDNIDQLAIMTLNRHQNDFRLYMANPRSTVAKQVLQDENPYYVDAHWAQNICFGKDNFVYVSERDGYAHIYLYSMTGVLEKQLTSGPWDVTELYGFNPTTKTVFYQSAEESPLRRAIYKVDAKGNKTKLTDKAGTNAASFSRQCKYFVNNFSNVNTPNRISILDDKGKEHHVINDNAALKNTLAGLNMPTKEFFTFSINTGEMLNGWILKPADFNPGRQYPLLMIQYSGPNSQEVTDRYVMDWYYYLCNQGYIVAAVDSRGTGARGQEFRKCTYRQLGLMESDDQIAAARYLGNQSYIDQNRIAIWGWSYGGTITLMSMSRSENVFKAGVAIAPVTDWRFYDSVYTERFMRTPKENFTNYDRCSPIKLADKLNGQLLLVHGTADDNVHYQNTLDYTAALVEASKQFDMHIYSNKNHSILGVPARTHLFTKIINFLDKNL